MDDLKNAFRWWQATDADLRFYGAAVFFGLVLLVSWVREHSDLFQATGTRKLPPVGKPHLLLRPFRRFKEPLWIGDVKIDFREQHMDFLAMSGGFKTTLMAYLARQRLKRGRPIIVITGGDSDQLETEVRAAGGWVIRPHESPLTFNAFEGTPSYMAQGWAQLFPTNSEAKVYHSAFEISCIEYFEEAPKPYSLHGLKQYVLAYEPEDQASRKLWDGMKGGYVGIRLKLMEKAFGDWIGDQLSINAAVRQKVPLMFVLDSASDPDLNRFAAALVWQAVNFAVRETGGFDVFVDELGRLPHDLVGDQVRTWRRNDCHLLAGSHSSADFTEIMGDLIHIHCLGRMTASALKTRAWAHQVTWGQVPRENFGAHSLKRGQFVVVDLERIQIASLPTYKPPKHVLSRKAMRHLMVTAKVVQKPLFKQARAVPEADPPSGDLGTAAYPARVHGPPEGKPRWVSGANVERKMEIWLRHVFPEGAVGADVCYETSYALKGKGKRPGCQYEGRDWLVYDLVMALDDCAVMGLGADEEKAYLALVKMKLATGELSVDHRCENRRCVRREHHEWETKGDNIDLFWERWRERRAAA